MIRVGVDVGGTFTGVVLERTRSGVEGDGVVVTKVPSTYADQSEGVLQVCRLAGVDPSEMDVLLHGTTVATNMVIERNGAEVGMLTTRGFRDILHMARHKLLDGFITPEHATEAYGVALRAIDDGYGWALEDAGTAALRAR